MSAHLDRISLDDFEVTTHAGNVIKPHKGQSVWTFGYGRSAKETQRIAATFSDGDREGQFAAMCQFVAGEIPKNDVINPRNGEPYGEADEETVGDWPDELLAYVARKLLGVESDPEG